MARLLIIGGFLAVVFWIFSIVDCAVQPPMRHRGVSKRAWMFIVVLLPVIGGILWFVLGRTQGRTVVPPPPAPDDDPEFLQSLFGREEQDARIAQLEAELARLDEEERAERQAEARDPSHSADRKPPQDGDGTADPRS